MADLERQSTDAQSRRFLLLYALAVCGGSIAYIPFLTLLLPLRASSLAGDEALTLLSQAAFVGAIAASLANIGFGWASDRTAVRKPWILAGLILSSGLLAAMSVAEHRASLLALILVWQVGLNMMLAPLAAWAGDCVPDHQKGLLGGLLAFAPALGALSGALITQENLIARDWQLSVVSALVVACVVPVLLAGRPRPMPDLLQPRHVPDENDPPNDQVEVAVAVRRMWLARLCIQIAEASLFAFLLLWLRSIDPSFSASAAATIFSAVLCVSVGCTLIVGHWSDHAGRPILPLAVSAGSAGAGLLVMGFAPSLSIALAGYVLFGLASSVFLALHSSQTLRVLPAPQSRGRDLGVFNLTNTLPSLLMPGLTLTLVPVYGFDALFLVLAGLAVVACLLLTSIHSA